MTQSDKKLFAEEGGKHVELSPNFRNEANPDAVQRFDCFTPQEQEKIVRRVDFRLVVTLGFMFSVSLMDRINLGIAVVAGMGVDLQFIGSRYSIIVLVFFTTYVIFQPPATVLIRKFGPRNFLCSITILWGATMIAFGFVRKWTDLVALRLVLGTFEAGFFPGCAYLLSCWYPRYDLHKRNAVFYLIGSLLSAFSGILAYGFSQLAGHGSGASWMGQSYGPTAANPVAPSGRQGGLAGWRWIFILQGVITCIVAIVAFPIMVDFPEKSAEQSHKWNIPFLSKDEAAFIVARIEKDRQDTFSEDFKLVAYLRHATDLKVWGFACLLCLTTTISYAIAYFLPIILNQGMGFSVAASQCLNAPPYVLAAIVTYACAWAGDKYRIRSPFIIGNAFLGLIGVSILGFSTIPGVRYFGVFLAVVAGNANLPCILTWQANNIRGQWKRAFCSATLVGAGGVGGIIGGTVFRTQDAPNYVPGMIATIVACGLTVLLTLILAWHFKQVNRHADSKGYIIEGLQGFRYTL